MVMKDKNKINVLSTASTLPGIITALLPKIVCPFCWPAYAGIMSALGISITSYSKYLFPLTIIFLIFALIGLSFKASQRWGYKPFMVGAAGALFIITAKFYWNSDVLLYIGITMLLGASIWNIWPKRKKTQACLSCITK